MGMRDLYWGSELNANIHAWCDIWPRVETNLITDETMGSWARLSTGRSRSRASSSNDNISLTSRHLVLQPLSMYCKTSRHTPSLFTSKLSPTRLLSCTCHGTRSLAPHVSWKIYTCSEICASISYLPCPSAISLQLLTRVSTDPVVVGIIKRLMHPTALSIFQQQL